MANFTGGPGNDRIFGTGDPDVIDGREGHDELSGLGGDDHLIGGVGNDILDGGAGADVMEGGGGHDRYFVDHVGDQVIEPGLGSGDDRVFSSISYTLGAYLDHLTLTGTDAIDGGGNNLANVIMGNSAANVLLGDRGDDTLRGEAGDDTLRGQNGDDVLDGGLGADAMYGGTGNDTYYVDDVGDTTTENRPDGGYDRVFSSATHVMGAYLEDLDLTGTSAADGTGNAFDNVIDGNSAANVLKGEAGADRLSGHEGDDVLHGGAGDDRLVGGLGIDVMYGGDGDDLYIFDSARLFGPEGGEAIEDSADGGIDQVEAWASFTLGDHVENLRLMGQAVSGTGNDIANLIRGNGRDNILIGHGGDDLLSGQGGADTMYGGAGDDAYFVDQQGDRVVEEEGNGIDEVHSLVGFTLPDHVENLSLDGARNGTGNSLDNVIIGGGIGAINNTLRGRAGDDRLSGNAGDDLLNGGKGADWMSGGRGNDTFIVDHAGDEVVEAAGFGEGIDTVISHVTHLLAPNVENLILGGRWGISGFGNELDNSLTGNAAGNRLDGGSGADTMAGGAGSDGYFVDHVGDQVIENAGEGVDKVNSFITYALGDHLEDLRLLGAEAIDGTGNSLDNLILGNGAANRLEGGAGADALGGGRGGDILDGGAGADTMYGSRGDDTYHVDDPGDRTIERSATYGTDHVISSISHALQRYVENLTLAGDQAIDGTGNGRANTIIGNSAANVLSGGRRADVLAGGTGNDVLNGGAGADAFVFDTTPSSSDNVDLVEDFVSGLDQIRLAASVFSALAEGALPEEAFAIGTEAAEADDRIVYDSATGALFYDADGSGSGEAVQFATLAGAPALAAADFLIMTEPLSPGG